MIPELLSIVRCVSLHFMTTEAPVEPVVQHVVVCVSTGPELVTFTLTHHVDNPALLLPRCNITSIDSRPVRIDSQTSPSTWHFFRSLSLLIFLTTFASTRPTSNRQDPREAEKHLQSSCERCATRPQKRSAYFGVL